MDVVGIMASPLKRFAPGLGQDGVTAVADRLGEPVLWSGSGLSDGSVDGWLRHAAVSFGMSGICLSLGILVLLAARRRRGRSRILAGVAAAASLLPCVLLAFTGNAFVDGAKAAATAYVVTASRLVVLSGNGDREDVPAKGVEDVRAVPGGVEFALGDGRKMTVRGADAGRGGLLDAARALKEAGGTRT